MAGALALAGVCVLTAGACGGSHDADSARRALARRYQAVADPANAEVATAKARLEADTKNLAQAQADLVAIGSAKRAFDDALQGLGFPTSMQPHVAQLLADDATLEARLAQGEAARSTTALAMLQGAILAAGQNSVAAADVLRADLGLPPAP